LGLRHIKFLNGSVKHYVSFCQLVWFS